MKNKVIVFFITFFVIMSSMVGVSLFINYLRDPLQLFSQKFNSQKLIDNARHQVSSIIKLYPFNSIILGTSMLENTSSKESSNILGGNFMNLSLSGSDFNTRSLILNYTLKNKRINKIIYSLDSNGLVNHSMKDTSNFDFLYDDNQINDIKIYLNKKYNQCLFDNSCYSKNIDMDRPYSWYKVKGHSKRFGGLDNWFKAKNNSQIKSAFKSILESIQQIKLGKKNIDIHLESNILKNKKYIDKTILKYVSTYPETEFILIIPPYSRIKYAIDAQYNVSDFEKYKVSIKYLVNKSHKYPNLKIYGWGNHSFVDNIKNYKDLHHYEYKINSWMLSAIKREEGLLTIDNVDTYLERFTEKALDYNLLELGNKIDNYLNTK